MKKLILLLATIGFFVAPTSAQHTCGFDDIHQARMQNDPAYAQAVQLATQVLANKAQFTPSMIQVNGNDTIYEVPVVIHVIHTGNAIGGLYNPSDANIQAMINTLNNIYAASVSGWPTPSTGGVDMGLRFKLAQRSPTCGPTTGINRIDGSFLAGYSTDGVRRYGSVGPSDADLKSVSRWDGEKYYNIWLVSAIDGYDGYSGGGVAGYALLPFGGPSLTDGTVMLSKFANSNPDDVEVLAHELGHAFGLYHTFDGDNGGNNCPTETNCATQNDEVCDTEPHIRSFGCPTGTNTCTGATYQGVSYNIMNYTNCVNRFTPGQQVRLFNTAEVYRNNLIHSATAEPLPTTPMTAASCTPTTLNPGNFLNVGPASVKLGQINYESEGYTQDGNMVYIDNSCIAQTTLVGGQSYTIQVGTKGYAQKVKAYIDYNSDGVFTTSEEILSVLNSSSGTQTHSATFTVPTTAVTCRPLRMRVISDRLTSPTPSPCAALAFGQAEDYAVIIEGTDTVGIQLTSGSNPSCPGTPLTFQAVTSSAGPVTYNWKLNGSTVGTGNTYSTSTAANGAVLTLTAYVPSLCSPGQTDTLTSTLTILRQANTNVQASLNILQGNDTLCIGEQVHLQTAIQNGTNPSYQWMVGTTPVGTGTDTLQYTPSNGDQIYCQITDANSCFTGTINSDTIQFTVVTNIAPTASIVASPAFPICQGETVTFTATTTNGGLNPTYNWFVNNATAATGTTTFTTSTLNDGDDVRFVMTSALTCASDPDALSNIISADVNPLLPVSATTTFIQGSNVICSGDAIVLQGSVTNGGATPIYDWSVNGTFFASGNPMSFSGINNGDVITLTASSSEACVTGNPATSSQTITVHQYPAPLQISLVGNELRAFPPATQYQWYGPNGIISGATAYNYTPTMNGQYYCIPNNPPCVGEPSNVLEIYVVGTKILDVSDFKLYPNPADHVVTLKMADMKASQIYLLSSLGQRIPMNYELQSQDEYVMDISEMVPGFYILEVQTSDDGVYYVKLQIQ